MGKIKGIDLYKAVVQDQDESYLDKVFKYGESEIRVHKLTGGGKMHLWNNKKQEIALNRIPYNRLDWIMETEWEEVKQPISWEEALKAAAEGKTILCKTNRDTTSEIWNKYEPNLDQFLDQDREAISRFEILNGEWYIED